MVRARIFSFRYFYFTRILFSKQSRQNTVGLYMYDLDYTETWLN